MSLLDFLRGAVAPRDFYFEPVERRAHTYQGAPVMMRQCRCLPMADVPRLTPADVEYITRLIDATSMAAFHDACYQWPGGLAAPPLSLEQAIEAEAAGRVPIRPPPPPTVFDALAEDAAVWEGTDVRPELEIYSFSGEVEYFDPPGSSSDPEDRGYVPDWAQAEVPTRR